MLNAKYMRELMEEYPSRIYSRLIDSLEENIKECAKMGGAYMQYTVRSDYKAALPDAIETLKEAGYEVEEHTPDSNNNVPLMIKW